MAYSEIEKERESGERGEDRKRLGTTNSGNAQSTRTMANGAGNGRKMGLLHATAALASGTATATATTIALLGL